MVPLPPPGALPDAAGETGVAGEGRGPDKGHASPWRVARTEAARSVPVPDDRPPDPAAAVSDPPGAVEPVDAAPGAWDPPVRTRRVVLSLRRDIRPRMVTHPGHDPRGHERNQRADRSDRPVPTWRVVSTAPSTAPRRAPRPDAAPPSEGATCSGRSDTSFSSTRAPGPPPTGESGAPLRLRRRRQGTEVRGRPNSLAKITSSRPAGSETPPPHRVGCPPEFVRSKDLLQASDVTSIPVAEHGPLPPSDASPAPSTCARCTFRKSLLVGKSPATRTATGRPADGQAHGQRTQPDQHLEQERGARRGQGRGARGRRRHRRRAGRQRVRGQRRRNRRGRPTRTMPAFRRPTWGSPWMRPWSAAGTRHPRCR